MLSPWKKSYDQLDRNQALTSFLSYQAAFNCRRHLGHSYTWVTSAMLMLPYFEREKLSQTTHIGRSRKGAAEWKPGCRKHWLPIPGSSFPLTWHLPSTPNGNPGCSVSPKLISHGQCMHTQSHLTLCNPMDCSPPCSSVQRISQARVPEWVAISYR